MSEGLFKNNSSLNVAVNNNKADNNYRYHCVENFVGRSIRS